MVGRTPAKHARRRFERVPMNEPRWVPPFPFDLLPNPSTVKSDVFDPENERNPSTSMAFRSVRPPDDTTYAVLAVVVLCIVWAHFAFGAWCTTQEVFACLEVGGEWIANDCYLP